MTAGLMAYNIVLVFGFLNYLIALGGALLAAALWLRLRRRPWIVRAAAGGLCAAALFFIHIFGVTFFALLVGAAELDELALRSDEPVGRRLSRAASLLAATLAVPLYLWTLVPAHLSDTLIHRGALLTKLFFLAGPFIGYAALPGPLVGGAFYGFAGWWIARRACGVGPGIPVAALMLVAAWLALPFAIGGGTFLDSRIPLMLALALAAGIGPPAMRRRTGQVLALAATIALCLEVTSTAITWHRHEAPIADLRRTIAAVPAGARVLVVSAPLDGERSPPPGLLALGIFRTDYNLGALLAIDRRAFWPGLFADPSQQPIAVQAPFDRLAAPGWPPEIGSLKLERSTDPNWPAPYLKDWQDNFDFVLVLNAGAIPDIADYLPGKLLLRNLTPAAALFSVKR